MSATSRLPELDLLRKQVADLARELTERDQTFLARKRQLDDELQDLRERSDMLRAIVTGTSAETGDDFFPTLVCHLSSVLGVQYAVVGEVQHSPVKRIRTIAVSAGGSLVDNFEYPLMNTPCETALGQSFACFERDTRTLFPLFERLGKLGVEGYCGVPLRAKGGAVLGLLVVMDTKPLRNTERLKSLMAVFASRAGAELQRRQAEMRLNQQQRHLVEAQALAHLGSWDWEIDSGNVQWSDELCRILGYEPGRLAVTYETFVMALHPSDRPGVLKAIDGAMTGTPRYDVECRIVRPCGEIRTVQCSGEVLRDASGRPVSVASSVLDITDRKRVEDTLRISQDQLQQALHASSTGLWSWNTETNDVVLSEEWKRQLGYGATELPDSLETWTRLLHPEDREGAIAYAQWYMNAPGGEYRQAFRLQHKDGTYRWIEARASFVTEADGRRIRLLGSHTDITERKQMEDTVQESEQRYRTLVELSPSGVFVFCEGRTVYVNRTGALLMGAQAPQEILDRPTFDFIHPDYHHEVRENVKRLLSGGVSVHRAERIYLRLDGTPIPVQVEAGRIMWNGKPALLGMFSDITERKRTEAALASLNATLERQVSERTEALRLSEERFRQFFDHAPNVTALKDRNGRYLYTNRRFDEVFGIAAGMALGKTDAELFSPEQADQFQSHDRQVFSSRTGQEFEEVTQQRDGLRTSIVVKFPVTDASGHLSAIGVIATDITERKRIQEELRLYREIFTHSIDGIAVIDLQGRYLQRNYAHEQLLGYVSDDLREKTPAFHLGEESFAHIEKVLADTGSFRGEVEGQTKNGAVLALDLTAFAVKDAEGRPICYVGIKRDVTERNRAQAALRASEERLRLAMEAADLGAWDVNVRTGEAVWSQRHARMQGYEPSPGTVSIQRWKDRIHPDDLDRVMAEVERAQQAHGLFSVEHRTVWGDSGEERWLSLYGRFFYDEAGIPVRFSGVSIDITERNRAQEALRESEARWQQFAESVGSVFWIADVTPDERKVLYVNAAFTFIWGIEREEIYRNWSLWLDSIHPDDRMRVKASHDRFVHGGATAVFHCEYRIVGRDGHIRWISDRRARMTGWEHRVAGIAEDITHHKQQLALMAQTEAIGEIGGWQLDFLTDRLWWSDETYRLHETTSELYSPTVETALNFYTPESRPIMADALAKGMEQGKPWDLELELITAKGRRIAVRAVGKVDVVSGGAVRAYGTFQDITERKRAEEALQQTHDELERKVLERTAELQASEERYRTLYDETPSMYFTVNGMGIIRSVNHYGARYLGYRVEDLVGKSVAAIIFEEDRECICAEMSAFFRHPDGIAQWEFRKVRGDGTVLWVREFARVLQRHAGESLALIVCDDITERKQAEQALRESEERFSKAFRASLHPIGITEMATGRCIEVNDACLELFGFRRGEVIGQTTLVLGIWPHHEERARLVERLKSGESVRNLEVSVRTKSGELRHVLVSSELAELNGTVCMVTVGNDITERKKAEEALRISEERFAKAFRASPHPVVISELDSGRVVDVNDAACQMFGYCKEDVVGQTTLQVGVWHSAEERICYLERLKREGSVRNVEVKLRSRNGDVRQCLLSSELIELNGKRCMVTVGDDITESKRLEKALRLTQFSVDQAVEAIVWLDPNARMFSVNDTACRMLEYSREELMTMTVHDIDPNFPVERWMDHWNYLKQQGSLTFEARFWSRTGVVLETDVTVNYLLYEGNEYGCMILRDIRERKRAEAELRQSHKFLRQVIDTAPNLIFAKDQEGCFTMANQAVADCYGTSVDDLMGKADADFNTNPEEVKFFRQIDLEVMQCVEERFIPEERITDAEGKTRWLQTVKRPIFDDDGHVRMVLGAATDITERKRMEEMLLQRERDLSAALQERERISQDLHDGILQSLYAVGLGLEACKPMIKQQPGRLSTKFMTTLDQSIGQLNHVMGEVRNFIAGLESHVIQGGDFATALRDMVHAMSSSSSAICTVRIDPTAARHLSTEQALHIINIVREGLSNALRHSGATRITVSLRSLIRSVRLAITDNGIGFNTSSTQGVGHGLANMAARAQKVRGVFTLESTPSNGTKVSLDLPKETTYAHN